MIANEIPALDPSAAVVVVEDGTNDVARIGATQTARRRSIRSFRTYAPSPLRPV